MRRFLAPVAGVALMVVGFALLAPAAGFIVAGAALIGGWYLFEEVDE